MIRSRTAGSRAASPPAPASRSAAAFASDPVARGRPREERWEAGFLRLSGGRPIRGLSYLVDPLGAAHDATARSELERLLQEPGWETPELLERAEAGMARLRAARRTAVPPRPLDADALGVPALPEFEARG